MKFKVVMMLLLIVLLTCATAFAAERTTTISGVGTFVLSDVRILPLQIPTADVGMTLLADDNNTVRTINVFFRPVSFTRKSMENSPLAMGVYFDELVEKLYKDLRNINILTSPYYNKSAIYDEQLIIKRSKSMLYGCILDLNYYVIDGKDGLVVLGTLCPVGDADYWKPIIAKMIADMQR